MTRFKTVILSLLLATVVCPHDGVCNSTQAIGDALANIDAGHLVKVGLANGTFIEGVYAGTLTDRFFLDGPHGPEPVVHSDVIALWTRGRAIVTGAKIGALGAGVPSAAFGVLMGAALGLEGGLGILGTGLLFGAMGFVSGGVVGGIAGSAFPQWKRVWGEDIDIPAADIVPDTSNGLPEPPDVGGFGFGLGAAGALSSEGTSGLAWHGQLTARIGRHWEHGLEIGWANTGMAAQEDRPNSLPISGGTSVWNAGWRMEIPAWDSTPGQLVPYVIAGVAVYSWQETYVGGNLGVGLKVEPRRHGLGVQLEARRHDNMQALMETNPAHWTAVASIVTRW